MTGSEPTPARPARSPRWRVAALGGASLVLVGGAAITMAASPAPSGSPDTGTDTEQGDGARPFPDAGPGFFGGRHGGFGGGSITITAIDGSALTLETVDGWTRTIDVTDETGISKAGDEAALTDLEVGDRVRFRQEVEDDDSYTITDLAVIQPTVMGVVTAKDADSITIETRDGSSVTVNVDADTELRVGRDGGTSLDDVEVGMVLGAAGELNDDGSLDASQVRAGAIGDGRGRGHRHDFGRDEAPESTATPEDSSSTSAS